MIAYVLMVSLAILIALPFLGPRNERALSRIRNSRK